MKKHRVIVSLITVDNDFQMEQAAAAEEAARRLELDLEILFADGDSIEQSQQVLRFVQAKPGERPDGIVFEPVGGPALAVVARAAVEAGIGWVVLNKQVEYVKELRQGSKVPVFIVTHDHREMGRIQGQQLAALLPNGGSVLSIEGPAESDACKLRIAGLAETKPANIQLKTMRGNWTQSSAFNTVQSWLRLSTSRHNAIVAVAAQNDAMAVGAKKAFEEFGREVGGSKCFEHLLILGMDGVPTSGQAWVKSQVLAATIVAPPLTGTALDLLVHSLRTREVAPEVTFLDPYSFPALPAMKPQAQKRAMALAVHTYGQPPSAVRASEARQTSRSGTLSKEQGRKLQARSTKLLHWTCGASLRPSRGRRFTHVMRITRRGFYRRRLPHLQRDYRPHFVTFCTYQRWILPELARAIVLDCCLHEHDVTMTLHACVVMPDHVHLIFTPRVDDERREICSLARIMDAIKGASAHKINKALGRQGCVWQAESFDRVLRSSESLDAKVAYVLANPVRAGLVSVPAEYRWVWRKGGLA